MKRRVRSKLRLGRCLVPDHNLEFVKKPLLTIRFGRLHLVDEMVN